MTTFHWLGKSLHAVAVLLLCAWLTPTYAADPPPDPATFDHLITGFPLDGEHDQLPCEKCHVGGIFDALPRQCEQCHDGVFAVGQPPNHVVTSAPCDSCHTPIGFAASAQVLFDHSAVTGERCDSCHNGINATGKPNNHIVTTADCGTCHNINTWIIGVFDHTTVEPIISCTGMGCHSAAEKPSNHPLTTDVCIACHVYTGWTPTNRPFDHSQVLQTNCVSSGCHNANERPPTHPRTTDVCEACHSTAQWFPPVRVDHDQIIPVTCVGTGCHNSTEKQPGHPPTTDACEACHNGGQWLPVITPFAHEQAIFVSCVGSGCHNSADKGGNHPLTTDNCDVCHNTGFWIPVKTPFDHGEVLTTSCESVGCHDASDKSPNHVPAPDYCGFCHHSLGSWLPAQFDHSGVTGECAASGCHDGTGVGQGKPPTHPLTTNTCDSCHSYPVWAVLNTPFDHIGVMESSCNRAGCHSAAADKLPTHPAVVTDSCELCHPSMGSWIVTPAFDHGLTTEVNCAASGCHTESDKGTGHPAVLPVDCGICHTSNQLWQQLVLSFDHSLTTEVSCTVGGCHTATEKGANHPPTTNECAACHDNSNNAWLPVILPFDHSRIATTTCTTAGCHSSADKTATHPQTSDRCDQCHAAGSWLPMATINHADTTDACDRCHAGSPARGKGPSHPGTTNFCENCHTPGAAAWTSVNIPFSHDHVTQPNCASVGCHSDADKSPSHPQTSSACEACHQNTMDWMDASAPTHFYVDGCGDPGCHGGGSGATSKPPTHPLTTPLCQACHAYPSWTPRLSTIDHAQATDLCANCHDGIKARGKDLNHIVTSLPCDTCHNDTVNFLNVTFDHANVSGQSCSSVSCHDGVSPRTFKPQSHPFTTNTCDGCHDSNAWVPLLPNIDHGQTSEVCEVCHNGSIATGKGPTHIPTVLPCDSCHDTVLWQNAVLDHSTVAGLACASAGCHDGVTAGATYKSATHPVTSELCEACHNTTNWNPFTPIDHSQTTDLCGNCHNGTVASGKPGGHCPTSLDCGLCHVDNGWRQILPNAPACNGTGGGTQPPGGGGGGGTNELPQAIINAAVTSGVCNTAYTFDGSASFDPEGQPLTYQWWALPQGTGTIATPWQMTTTITFTTSGTKTIRLIVNDGVQDSQAAEVTFTVTVSHMGGC